MYIVELLTRGQYSHMYTSFHGHISSLHAFVTIYFLKDGLTNAALYPYICACHYVYVDSPHVCIVFRPVELPVWCLYLYGALSKS